MSKRTKGVAPLDMLPPKKKKKEPKKWALFSIRIEESLAHALQDIARESGYARNEVIGRFLEWARVVYAAQKTPLNKAKNNKDEVDE